MKKLQDFVSFKEQQATPLEALFTAASDDLLELLHKIFHWCPTKRCTTTEALQMRYFRNKPFPTPPHLIPKPGSNTIRPDDIYGKRKSDNMPSIPKRLKFEEDM